jgi:DNA-binding IclR family transcriptional regulator
VRKKSGRNPPPSRGDQSGDRLLAALGLFTIERPVWTVPEIAGQLGVSTSTAYRYVRSLTAVGLLSPVSRASYVVGPAVMKLDRQLQITDPILNAARGVMRDVIEQAPDGSVVLLCRLFHDGLICVHQVVGRGPQPPITHERGRPSSLLIGANGKIMLAHLPPRTMTRLVLAHQTELATAGLGKDLAAVRQSLRALRKAGFAVSRCEMDEGRVAVAAPLFDPDGKVVAGLSLSLMQARVDDAILERQAAILVQAARTTQDRLSKLLDASGAAAGRLDGKRIKQLA